MPHNQLCPDCRSLLLGDAPAPPHAKLQMLVERSGYRLFRCSGCNAFAALQAGEEAWSFNLFGTPVVKPSLI